MIPLAIAIITSLIQLENLSGPAASTLAQEQDARITADDAVRMMLQNNPRVQAVVLEYRAANRGLDSARAWANPSLTVTPGLTRSGSDEELLIAQPLEINGTRTARTGVAFAHLRSARSKGRIEMSDLVFQTRTAFAEVARAEERRALAQELLKAAEEFDRIAQRQVEIGTRAGIEQSQTKIEVFRARQQATLAEADLKSAVARLNTLMGKPSDTQLFAARLVFAAVEVSAEKLSSKAIQDHPEVRLAAAEKEAFQQEAMLARAEGLPDIAPHYRMSSLFREPRDGGFGIGISIPIFDFGSRRNRIRQAEESARAQEKRLDAARSEIRQNLAQAIERLRAAEAVLADYSGGLLDEAKKLFEATRKGFQLGQSNIPALLEAQRTYRAIQTEYIDALVSHAIAKAELDHAAGVLPEDLLPRELKRQENE